MTRTQTLGAISFHEHERPSLGGIQPQLDHLLPGRSFPMHRTVGALLVRGERGRIPTVVATQKVSWSPRGA